MATKIRNTYFYCHFENIQPNWLDRSCWNFQDRQRSGFEGCSENFVLIWHLWPILQADKGRKWQQKYVIRIFIATLKMYSQTGWTDQSETFRIVKGVDLRAEYKILSRSDTYGRFYRPKRLKMVIKIRITYFCCHFRPLSSSKIGHRCQIGTKFS